MKKLVEKIWVFLSKFVDSDGAYDYAISVDGYAVIIKSTTGIITFPVLKYFVDLQASMSEFFDCGFYLTHVDDVVALRFYIKNM